MASAWSSPGCSADGKPTRSSRAREQRRVQQVHAQPDERHAQAGLPGCGRRGSGRCGAGRGCRGRGRRRRGGTGGRGGVDRWGAGRGGWCPVRGGSPGARGRAAPRDHGDGGRTAAARGRRVRCGTGRRCRGRGGCGGPGGDGGVAGAVGDGGSARAVVGTGFGLRRADSADPGLGSEPHEAQHADGHEQPTDREQRLPVPGPPVPPTTTGCVRRGGVAARARVVVAARGVAWVGGVGVLLLRLPAAGAFGRGVVALVRTVSAGGCVWPRVSPAEVVSVAVGRRATVFWGPCSPGPCPGREPTGAVLVSSAGSGRGLSVGCSGRRLGCGPPKWCPWALGGGPAPSGGLSPLGPCPWPWPSGAVPESSAGAGPLSPVGPRSAGSCPRCGVPGPASAPRSGRSPTRCPRASGAGPPFPGPPWLWRPPPAPCPRSPSLRGPLPGPRPRPAVPSASVRAWWPASSWSMSWPSCVPACSSSCSLPDAFAPPRPPQVLCAVADARYALVWVKGGRQGVCHPNG